jgi:hypothetical protein
MNQVKKNGSTIPTRIAPTLNVILLPLIYIAQSIGSDSPTICSEMEEGDLMVS